jgi:hypothetical protein
MDWDCAFVSFPSKCSKVDLMIIDNPIDKPIPDLSSLPNFVPQWNKHQPGFLDIVFDFASTHVHNRGAVLLLHSDDAKIKTNLKGFIKAYYFVVFKEWLSINSLRMTSAKDHFKTVSLAYTIWIFLLSPYSTNAAMNSYGFLIYCHCFRLCGFL